MQRIFYPYIYWPLSGPGMAKRRDLPSSTTILKQFSEVQEFNRTSQGKRWNSCTRELRSTGGGGGRQWSPGKTLCLFKMDCNSTCLQVTCHKELTATRVIHVVCVFGGGGYISRPSTASGCSDGRQFKTAYSHLGCHASYVSFQNKRDFIMVILM